MYPLDRFQRECSFSKKLKRDFKLQKYDQCVQSCQRELKQRESGSVDQTLIFYNLALAEFQSKKIDEGTFKERTGNVKLRLKNEIISYSRQQSTEFQMELLKSYLLMDHNWMILKCEIDLDSVAFFCENLSLSIFKTPFQYRERVEYLDFFCGDFEEEEEEEGENEEEKRQGKKRRKLEPAQKTVHPLLDHFLMNMFSKRGVCTSEKSVRSLLLILKLFARLMCSKALDDWDDCFSIVSKMTGLVDVWRKHFHLEVELNTTELKALEPTISNKLNAIANLVYFTEGVCHLRSKDYELAIQKFSTLLSDNKRSSSYSVRSGGSGSGSGSGGRQVVLSLQFLLGVANFKLRYYKTALTHFKETTCPSKLFFIGLIQYYLGDFSKAFKCFHSIVQQQQDHPQESDFDFDFEAKIKATVNMFVLHSRVHDYKSQFTVLNNLWMVMQQKKKLVVQCVDFSVFPTPLIVLCNLSFLALQIGNYSFAVDSFKFIFKNRDNADLFYSATNEERLGRVFEDCLKAGYASSLLKSGSYAPALRFINECLETTPKNVQLMIMRLDALLNLGESDLSKLAKGIKDLESEILALEEDDEDEEKKSYFPQFYTLKGIITHSIGAVELALQSFEKCLLYDRSNESVIYNLVILQFEMGLQEEAIVRWFHFRDISLNMRTEKCNEMLNQKVKESSVFSESVVDSSKVLDALEEKDMIKLDVLLLRCFGKILERRKMNIISNIFVKK